ncbi:hypothetical protein TcWFU_003737 [Taenia crassiceps]|uniref:MAM domain-containing protein n=1 Tax=Taenia crassiceps TaxID=6207 RepID=A0ABR4QGB8_9CEST
MSKPLLTWTFSEDLEDWTNDGDNWLHKWKVSSVLNQTLLCLQTKPTQQSRQSILLSRKKDVPKPNIQARLLSPPVPSDLRLRCLAITYSFNLGSGATSLTCGFENGSLCEWGNDLNNWLATWKVESSVLCLKPLRQHSKSKMELFARLYSPFMSEEDSIGCGRTSSLSCDFESPGLQSFCGWNIDPRDSGSVWVIVWSPNLRTNVLCLTPATSSPAAAEVYAGGDGNFDLDDTNETVMRSKFWSPKFREASLNCTFDNGSLCTWSNDQNNWLATWEIVQRKNSILCLKPLRIPSEAKAEMPARLYSRFLSVQDRIGCFKFSYIISPSDVHEVFASLFACDFEAQGLKSLCGWKDDPRDNGAAWSIVWNPDIHTNILCMTLATNRYAADDDDNFGFGGINEPVMRSKLWSPKFYAAKTDPAPHCVEFLFMFDQPDGGSSSSLSLLRHSVSWMPDPRDSTAKWQIEDGVICLRPVTLPQHFDSFSDLGSSHSDRRARLWSADVHFLHNVQCLCFVYSLSSTSVDMISLSVLLHSSGNCQKILDAITGQEFEVCRPVPLWNSSVSRDSLSSSWNSAFIDLGTGSSADFKKFTRSFGSGYREDASD